VVAKQLKAAAKAAKDGQKRAARLAAAAAATGGKGSGSGKPTALGVLALGPSGPGFQQLPSASRSAKWARGSALGSDFARARGQQAPVHCS
jgi:hypothetical protein